MAGMSGFAEPDGDGRQDLWSSKRVERQEWCLPAGEVADCATYRIVGGQDEAFRALESFSRFESEPVAVDLVGLDQEMRSGFLAFLERTGLVVVDWATDDVVILTATRRPGGSSGVREPRVPTPPPRHLSAEAPTT